MATKTEKMLLLLKYLKRFTDKNNPTSMPLIDYYFEKKKGKNFFGSPSAKRKVKHQIIKELAEYLNTDSDGNLLPKEDWVIVYDGYGEEKTNDREFICNLYYNQPFSEEEVKIIEKSIDFNTELDDEGKEQLKQKIKKRLYNKYYGEPVSFLKNRGPIERKQYLREKYDGHPIRRYTISYKTSKNKNYKKYQKYLSSSNYNGFCNYDCDDYEDLEW